MKIRIIMIMLLVLSVAVCTLVACNDDAKIAEKNETSDLETEKDPDIGGNDKDDTHDEIPGDTATDEGAPVYETYKNLFKIGRFYNGVATFMTYKPSSEQHWSSAAGSWMGDYYLGVIDINGNVVVEPCWECSPYTLLPDFKYGYARFNSFNSDVEYLLDVKGNVVFKVGEENVSAIGNVAEGYLWVETVEEKLSGNVYTVDYYKTDGMNVVASFDGVRAFPEKWYVSNQSTLSPTGDAALIPGNDHSYSTLKTFNISEYDSSYESPIGDWSLEMNKHEAFEGASAIRYNISGFDGEYGGLATVMLTNSDNVWFYSIVDAEGKILMPISQNIAFPLSEEKDVQKYEFCKDMCPAKDVESGYWGYISPDGKWRITPQFSSANAFSDDGYAVVNDRIIIDTEGKTVLSPSGWVNEKIAALSDTYYLYADRSWGTYYLKFNTDGTVKIYETMSGGTVGSINANYEIKGGTMIITNGGFLIGCPVCENGEYSIRKEGDILYINDSIWKKKV